MIEPFAPSPVASPEPTLASRLVGSLSFRDRLSELWHVLRHAEESGAPLSVAALEARVMLSATPMAEAAADAEPGQVDAEAVVAALREPMPASSDQSSREQSESRRRELVIVDRGLPEASILADEVMRLAASDDTVDRTLVWIGDEAGIDAFADLIEQAAADGPLDAVHLLSHGRGAAVEIGGDWLTEETLDEHDAALARIGDSLGDGADLLLYGCETADGGDRFLQQIADRIGADVAASDDLTGAADRGGDWILERRLGEIEASTLDAAAWSHVLSTTIVIQEGEAGYKKTKDGFYNDADESEDRDFETKLTANGYDYIEISREDNESNRRRTGLIQFKELFSGGSQQIPDGEMVQSATLYLYTITAPGLPVEIQRVGSSWTGGGSDTDERAASQSAAGPRLSPVSQPADDEWTAFDVTESLQEWQANGDNFGWRLLTEDSNRWEVAAVEDKNINALPSALGGSGYLRPILVVETGPAEVFDITVDTTDDALRGSSNYGDTSNGFAGLLADRGADGLISFREAWDAAITNPDRGGLPLEIDFLEIHFDRLAAGVGLGDTFEIDLGTTALDTQTSTVRIDDGLLPGDRPSVRLAASVSELMHLDGNGSVLDGVALSGSFSTHLRITGDGNVVRNSFIGYDPMDSLPQAAIGIEVAGFGNLIGGEGEGNEITAANIGVQVYDAATTGTVIRGNSFSAGMVQAIDHTEGTNEIGDGDAVNAMGQNPALIDSVRIDGGDWVVRTRFAHGIESSYRVELYAVAADGAIGELLHADDIFPGSGPITTREFRIAAPAGGAAHAVAAIAHGVYGTSEFSPAVAPTSPYPLAETPIATASHADDLRLPSPDFGPSRSTAVAPDGSIATVWINQSDELMGMVVAADGATAVAPMALGTNNVLDAAISADDEGRFHLLVERKSGLHPDATVAIAGVWTPGAFASFVQLASDQLDITNEEVVVEALANGATVAAYQRTDLLGATDATKILVRDADGSLLLNKTVFGVRDNLAMATRDDGRVMLIARAGDHLEVAGINAATPAHFGLDTIDLGTADPGVTFIGAAVGAYENEATVVWAIDDNGTRRIYAQSYAGSWSGLGGCLLHETTGDVSNLTIVKDDGQIAIAFLETTGSERTLRRIDVDPLTGVVADDFRIPTGEIAAGSGLSLTRLANGEIATTLTEDDPVMPTESLLQMRVTPAIGELTPFAVAFTQSSLSVPEDDPHVLLEANQTLFGSTLVELEFDLSYDAADGFAPTGFPGTGAYQAPIGGFSEHAPTTVAVRGIDEYGRRSEIATMPVQLSNSDPRVDSPLSYSVGEDEVLTITYDDLLAVVTDPDPVTFREVTPPSSVGTLVGDGTPGGSFTFTPSDDLDELYDGETTTITLAFLVEDGDRGSATVPVQLNVTGADDPLVAADAAFTVPRNASFGFDPYDFDLGLSLADPDAFAIVASFPHSVAHVSGTEYRFAPPAVFDSPITITGTATSYDQFGGTDQKPITLTFAPAADPAPVAGSYVVSVDEDRSIALDPIGAGEATDDGGVLVDIEFLDLTPPNATVVPRADGSHIADFTPDPDWNGTTTVDYRVFDGVSWSAVATITVHVTPVNDAPIVATVTETAAEDATVEIDLSGLLSDADGDSLTVHVDPSDAPLGQWRQLPSGELEFQAPADWHGTIDLPFTVHDGTTGTAAIATVTITAVNDPPTAVGTALTGDEGDPIAIDVTDLIADVDGDSLTVTFVDDSLPDGFTLDHIAGEPIATLHAPADWNGPLDLPYTVTDGSLDRTATLRIVVAPINDAPTASAATLGFDEDHLIAVDVTDLIDDIDGDDLAVDFDETVLPTGLTLSHTPGEPTASVRVPPNWHGSFDLPYTVADDDASATATLRVVVRAVNDAPVALSPTGGVAEDGDATIAFRGLARDIDSPDVTIEFLDDPENGELSTRTLSRGERVTYTPHPDWHGTQTIRYRVSDGELFAIGTATINVEAANDAPVLAPGQRFAFDVNGDGIVGQVEGSDVDGDALTFSLSSSTEDNGFAISSDGTISRSTDAPLVFDDDGNVSLRVVATDPAGATDRRDIVVEIGHALTWEGDSLKPIATDAEPRARVGALFAASTHPAATIAFELVDADAGSPFRVRPGGRVVVLDPSSLEPGDYELRVAATATVDSVEADRVEQTVTVRVEKAVNMPPELVRETERIEVESDSLTLTLSDFDGLVSDVETPLEELEMSMSGSSAGVLEHTPEGEWVFTWTDPTAESETLDVTFSDGENVSRTLTLTLTRETPVAAPPPPPAAIATVSRAASPAMPPQQPMQMKPATSMEQPQQSAENDSMEMSETAPAAPPVAAAPANQGATSESEAAQTNDSAAEQGGSESEAFGGERRTAFDTIVTFVTQTAIDQSQRTLSGSGGLRAGAALQSTFSSLSGGLSDRVDFAVSSTTWAVFTVEGGLFQSLDSVSEDVTGVDESEQMVGTAAVSLGGSFTVGYVLWTLRSGLIVSGLLAQMPAWKLVDPLIVLDGLAGEDEDDESLESIIQDGAAGAAGGVPASDGAADPSESPVEMA